MGAAIDFSKWSPGGNTTLFFPLGGTLAGLGAARRAALARAAMNPRLLGGEQAGFVDLAQRRLLMAGGEFCLNASLAFGALLALAEEAGAPGGEYEVRVSGWPGPIRLTARGESPRWQAAASLALPECPASAPGEGLAIIRLPGITHLLLDRGRHPFPDKPEAAAAQLRQRFGLEGEPCLGCIWWREFQGRLEILPLVSVRATQTTNLESSCGSGSLALALHLAAQEAGKSFSILQPGGSSLEIAVEGGRNCRAAHVSGPVSLVASGRLWLDGTETGQ